MRKLFTVCIALLACSACFAGSKLKTGSFDKLQTVESVAVKVSWDNAVYAKGGTLQDFLNREKRAEDWEDRSVSYFVESFNQQTLTKGLRVKYGNDASSEAYVFEMAVLTIAKSGDVAGTFYLKDAKTSEVLATVEFSSDERDNDDDVAFRDQFESLGKSLGKIVAKALKK